jgi:hypothetical protein
MARESAESGTVKIVCDRNGGVEYLTFTDAAWISGDASWLFVRRSLCTDKLPREGDPIVAMFPLSRVYSAELVSE